MFDTETRVAYGMAYTSHKKIVGVSIHDENDRIIEVHFQSRLRRPGKQVRLVPVRMDGTQEQILQVYGNLVEVGGSQGLVKIAPHQFHTFGLFESFGDTD